MRVRVAEGGREEEGGGGAGGIPIQRYGEQTVDVALSSLLLVDRASTEH